MKKVHKGIESQLKLASTPEAQANSYYRWDLLTVDGQLKELEARDILGNLPRDGYRMTQMTKLMDEINEMTTKYATCLTDQTYVNFIKECLDQFKRETNDLRGKLDKMSKSFSDPTQSKDKSSEKSAALGVLRDELGKLSRDFRKQAD
jgi:septation ring formation regulator EzrA